jgi:hypothetical protein
VFDCLECAAESIAPRCAHCDCRILGHGVEQAGVIYCCSHCLREEGDRAVDQASRGSFPASDPPGQRLPSTPPRTATSLANEDGRVGWIFLWLLGVPIPVLLVLFLLRGCT